MSINTLLAVSTNVRPGTDKRERASLLGSLIGKSPAISFATVKPDTHTSHSASALAMLTAARTWQPATLESEVVVRISHQSDFDVRFLS